MRLDYYITYNFSYTSYLSDPERKVSSVKYPNMKNDDFVRVVAYWFEGNVFDELI